MLIEKIKADRIQAMKDKDTIKKDLLGTLIGEASKQDKVPADDKVIATIKKFIKSAEETLRAIKHKDVPCVQWIREIKILEAYLPKQLSEEQIREVIKICITCGDTNLGQIMKHFKTELEGRYDGALVSKLAKEIL